MPVSAPPPSWANLRNKPTTVAGFGISDMNTQTVANATNATNVTNVTTAQVLAAKAGAPAGAVGTYALLIENNATARLAGDTVAGSSLQDADCNATPNGAVKTGTWRCMAQKNNTGASTGRTTTWLRIA